MLQVAPRIDAQQAREQLKPRRRLLPRRATDRCGLDQKRLPHLELVWLPFLRVTADDGRSCVVCATTGMAARLDGVEPTSADEAEVAPPAIAHPRLVELARSHLGRVAAFTGARGRAASESSHRTEDLALPFWVLLYERRPGRLDFAALDATSGAKVGGAVRQALLQALTAGSRQATRGPTR